jgi:hypothetical protein
MAHVTAPNLRGKGISATKFTKAGEPKRSGNWSVSTVHYQSLQSRDYRVKINDGRLIVGDYTPLADVMGKMGYTIEELARNDEYLKEIVREGYTPIRGKKYESRKRLTRVHLQYSMDKVVYIYREEIYTDGDFDYNFPEY